MAKMLDQICPPTQLKTERVFNLTPSVPGVGKPLDVMHVNP